MGRWAVVIGAGAMCGLGACGGPVRAPQPAPVSRRSAPPPAPAAAAPAPRPAPARPAAKPVARPPAPVRVAARPAPAAPTVRAAKPPAPKPPPRPTHADSLRLESALLQERSHAPLARVLARRSGNPAVANRAAAAVVQESRRLRLSSSLVAAVLLVENTPMDTTAESDAGAIGLMQVMPFHEGGWGCPTDGLQQLEANICHGTHLLHMYLRRYRSVQTALWRYNGCVGRRVTRSCLRYPARVLRTAYRIRREMLLAPLDSLAEPETLVTPVSLPAGGLALGPDLTDTAGGRTASAPQPCCSGDSVLAACCQVRRWIRR